MCDKCTYAYSRIIYNHSGLRMAVFYCTVGNKACKTAHISYTVQIHTWDKSCNTAERSTVFYKKVIFRCTVRITQKAACIPAAADIHVCSAVFDICIAVYPADKTPAAQNGRHTAADVAVFCCAGKVPCKTAHRGTVIGIFSYAVYSEVFYIEVSDYCIFPGNAKKAKSFVAVFALGITAIIYRKIFNGITLAIKNAVKARAFPYIPVIKSCAYGYKSLCAGHINIICEDIFYP